MFNSRNVGRCIQHFLYCSFVLSLAILFGAHIIGCTFKNLAKNYVLHNFCWFSDIFSQTKYYHCDLSFPPLLYAFILKNVRNIYPNVKIFIEFMHKFTVLRTYFDDMIFLHFIYNIRTLHDMFRSKSVYRHKIGVAFATWVSPLSSTLLIHNK